MVLPIYTLVVWVKQGKTMPQTSHDWEWWQVYTTEKNIDADWGMVNMTLLPAVIHTVFLIGLSHMVSQTSPPGLLPTQ